MKLYNCMIHRSGSRLNAWSEKEAHEDDGRPYHTSGTLVSHTGEHQKIAQHVSHTNQREDQAAVVAPGDKDIRSRRRQDG